MSIEDQIQGEIKIHNDLVQTITEKKSELVILEQQQQRLLGRIQLLQEQKADIEKAPADSNGSGFPENIEEEVLVLDNEKDQPAQS